MLSYGYANKATTKKVPLTPFSNTVLFYETEKTKSECSVLESGWWVRNNYQELENPNPKPMLNMGYKVLVLRN